MNQSAGAVLEQETVVVQGQSPCPPPCEDPRPDR